MTESASPSSMNDPHNDREPDIQGPVLPGPNAFQSELDWITTSASVKDGRLLIIKAAPFKLRCRLDRRASAVDDDTTTAGQNARGTYSKAYTLQHPEIRWAHRGQGRYLPADELKKDGPSVPVRRSRHSQGFPEQSSDVAVKKEENVATSSTPVSLKRTATSLSEGPRRKRRAAEETLNDSLSTPPTYGLRHRRPDVLAASASADRADRLARRFKPSTGIDSLRRSTLRTQNSSAIDDVSEEEDFEDDEGGSEAGPGRKTSTYDKKYVDAHPHLTFYHTGNGWYKLGKRMREQTKMPLPRKASTQGLKRERDGSFSINGERTKSVHKVDLHKYPGTEFHHTGNGWYKLGPDPSGHRSSITVQLADEGEEDQVDRSVDKAYAEAHPEVEWMHRGNGRYKRKSIVDREPSPELEPSASAPSLRGRRRSEPTYSKDYVTAHPSQEFYHTGNARYKRGSRPSIKADPEDELSEAPQDEEEDSSILYDKAYVTAHPSEEFHHRGQGRYGRGPRPAPEDAREDHVTVTEDVNAQAGELVDSNYVAAHPHLTFHHRGQGRWGRGLPPAGSHSKIAIRGPDAKEKMAERRGEERRPVTPVDPGPPVTALLIKTEGPDKWPQYGWFYRGGGKWSRMSKQDSDKARQRESAAQRKTTAYSRARPSKRQSNVNDGPEAQIKRETVAANQLTGGLDGGHVEDDMPPAEVEKPKVRRGRRSALYGVQARGDCAGNKITSTVHSAVPTPKPRMLEPEEDVLGPEDLPHIFADKWPDSAENEGDELDEKLRETFPALNTDQIIASLTKFDPASRSLDNLKAIAANAQRALSLLQDEYINCDRRTAQHARIPRRPARGGRAPIDPAIFEDKKEADLYDYAFDPRKIGFQDPEAQRIIRDAEGRELRKRRNRNGIEPTETVPGWHFGEGAGELAPKRASRQPQRFENLAALEQPVRRRVRAANGMGTSMTPDVATPPIGSGVGGGVVANKRVLQLMRAESVSSSDGGPGGKTVRKGRPPGSKNLHKRKDAGIKKGPRKPKAVEGGEALRAEQGGYGGEGGGGSGMGG